MKSSSLLKEVEFRTGSDSLGRMLDPRGSNRPHEEAESLWYLVLTDSTGQNVGGISPRVPTGEIPEKSEAEAYLLAQLAPTEKWSGPTIKMEKNGPFVGGDRSTARDAIASHQRPTRDRHRTSPRLIRAIAFQVFKLFL